MPEPDAKPGHAQASGGPRQGPYAKTPDNNPYMPTNETGAVAFKEANPHVGRHAA